MNKDKIYKKNKDIAFREIDGETMVVNLDNGEYYNFNQTCSDIWNLLDGNNTIRKIITEISLILID